MSRLLPHLFVACSLLVAGADVEAGNETVVLEPSRDGTLFGPIADDLSSGSGQFIFAGRTSGGGSGANDLRRGLVRFDVSEIPSGSRIVTASLRMQIVWRPQAAAFPVTTSLHRLTAGWGEGDSVSAGGAGVLAQVDDVTWTDRFHPRVQWAAPGGDFESQPSSNVSVVGPGPYFFDGDGLIDDVQAWVDGEPNDGWILIGDEEVPSSVAKWVSRENVAPTLRPQLTVEFELPAGNPFDLTGDGRVDAADLGQVISAWGACTGCGADFNEDGLVDSADLGQLIANWDFATP